MTSNAPVRPQPRAAILEIDPYVPGKSRVPGLDKVHKLSSNESPLGPSPRAVEAVKALAEKLELYPDGASTALRGAIGRRYGLDPSRIICGNGSDELLALLAHVFLHPGEEGLYSQYGFLTYPICIRAAGGIPVVAEETDRTVSVDAILEKVSARTKIVFLANPNNPTGTYVPFSEVKRLHEGLPPHTLLVIDAAYAEYVTRNDYAAGLELASTADNVVVTRTFSKIHGLAGLRIGWGYGSAHIIDASEPCPRTLQSEWGRPGGRRREPRRRGAYRGRNRAQCALASLAGRGDRRAGDRGHAKRRKFSAADLPEGTRAGPPRTQMRS